MKGPFVELVIGELALATGARAEAQPESWVQEWWEDRTGSIVSAETRRQSGYRSAGWEVLACRPKNVVGMRDGWVHDGGAAMLWMIRTMMIGARMIEASWNLRSAVWVE